MVQITITIGDTTWSGDVEPESNSNLGGGGSKQKNQQQEGGKSKKSKKASKGTRKLSPYMKFAQEARKNIIAQNPELKSDIIAVGKKIGEQWRALSAEEKAKY